MADLICLGLGYDPQLNPDSPQFTPDSPDLPLTYKEQPEQILGTATDEPDGSELLILLLGTLLT